MPSPLAQKVTEAFQKAAREAVAINLARGHTVVGEVNGVWQRVTPLKKMERI